MILQEAIKSGKPFYRSAWAEEYDDGFQPVYPAFDGDRTKELPGLCIDDILEYDWQVELKSPGKEPGEGDK